MPPPQSAVRAQTVTVHTDATAKTVDTKASPSTETRTRTRRVATSPPVDPRAQFMAASATTAAPAVAVAAQTLAVSPLGTPEQLAAEQRAAETVNTLPVQLMKLVLQFGWMSTATTAIRSG